jgi:hypothetical protein
MLRRPLTTAALSLNLLLLAGCAETSPTAPDALPTLEATTVRSAVPLSLRGTVVAYESSAFDPVTARVIIRLTGGGKASLLGNYSFTADISLDPTTGIGIGAISLTAADGSTINASLNGLGIFLPDNKADITEWATVTGGTGRFARANGNFRIVRLLDFTTGRSEGSIDGSIVSGW